MNTWFSFKV